MRVNRAARPTLSPPCIALGKLGGAQLLWPSPPLAYNGELDFGFASASFVRVIFAPDADARLGIRIKFLKSCKKERGSEAAKLSLPESVIYRYVNAASALAATARVLRPISLFWKDGVISCLKGVRRGRFYARGCFSTEHMSSIRAISPRYTSAPLVSIVGSLSALPTPGPISYWPITLL